MKNFIALFLIFAILSCDNNKISPTSSQKELAEKAINSSYNIDSLRFYYEQSSDSPGYFLVNKELQECLDSFEFALVETQQATYENNLPCISIQAKVEGENCGKDYCYFELISENHFYSNSKLAYSSIDEKYYDFNGMECKKIIPDEYNDLYDDDAIHIKLSQFSNCSINILSVYKDNVLKREVYFNQTLSKDWSAGFYSCINYYNNDLQSGTDEYQTKYYGGDINCLGQNLFKKKMERDIDFACETPTKYSMYDFLSEYGINDFEKYKYSTSEVGRMLYEQRHLNLKWILEDWEIDGSRYRTNSEITELCKKKLKEDSNFSKY